MVGKKEMADVVINQIKEGQYDGELTRIVTACTERGLSVALGDLQKKLEGE